MHIVVTGGCGFIGSHVVDHLVRAGHRVRVADTLPGPEADGPGGPAGTAGAGAGNGSGWLNPAADYRHADVLDLPAMEAAVDGTDAVFHLAAVTNVDHVAADPLKAVRLNVEGTGCVLEAARRGGCGRVLLASSVWVYGAAHSSDGLAGEFTEDTPIDLPRAGHVYVSTKLSAELLAHSYRQMYGQHFTILRYGIPYGPRMRDELVVARFAQAALAGRPITIAGSGEQQRNYIYVEDLADAHIRALAPAAEDQTLALEGDTAVSVQEVADTVCDLLAPVPVEHVPARTADYEGRSISNALAKELLGWSPGTPFAEGVRRYLDWYRGLDPRRGMENGP
jgi:UDP-glucose 4-epimerase